MWQWIKYINKIELNKLYEIYLLHQIALNEMIDEIGFAIFVCSNKEPSPSQNTLSISLKKSYPVSSH